MEQRLEKNVLIRSVEYGVDLARKGSLWPLTFRLTC